MRQPELAAGADGADARLLEGCLRGACPLPDADVQSMAERAGMRWLQRRGTLLARTLIAQAPQVSVFHGRLRTLIDQHQPTHFPDMSPSLQWLAVWVRLTCWEAKSCASNTWP